MYRVLQPGIDQEFFYGDTFFTTGYTTREILKECITFEFRSTDVIVCSFPRTGTTVTQEITWQVLNHDIIQKDEKYKALGQRFCFLEYKHLDGNPRNATTISDLIETKPTERRLIKTHLPYSLLSENLTLEKVKPKLIFVFRNPKDTAVAFYRFLQSLGLPFSFPEFFEGFLTGKSVTGSYFDNYLEWWSLRDQENVLVLQFEDIVKQRQEQIRKVARFLEKEPTEEQIEIISHNTAFENMSKNELVNFKLGETGMHLRQGRCGTWKQTFTVAQSEAIDQEVDKKFKEVGLTFDYS